MPCPHIPHIHNINLKPQRRDPPSRLGHEIANAPDRIPQHIISHRPTDLCEIRHDDGHVVAVGEDMFLGEEAAKDGLLAFACHGVFEDEGEGDAEDFEHEGARDAGAELVEAEGEGGAGDGVGDEIL